ncbi:hypothetical protein D3C81_1732320 [compost metagenome]
MTGNKMCQNKSEGGNGHGQSRQELGPAFICESARNRCGNCTSYAGQREPGDPLLRHAEFVRQIEWNHGPKETENAKQTSLISGPATEDWRLFQ